MKANQAGARYTDDDLGFVTTQDRFVDRAEAELIGLRNNQLRPDIQDPSMVHAADFSHFVEGLDEAMSRRDFLGNMGRLAAGAAVAPTALASIPKAAAAAPAKLVFPSNWTWGMHDVLAQFKEHFVGERMRGYQDAHGATHAPVSKAEAEAAWPAVAPRYIEFLATDARADEKFQVSATPKWVEGAPRPHARSEESRKAMEDFNKRQINRQRAQYDAEQKSKPSQAQAQPVKAQRGKPVRWKTGNRRREDDEWDIGESLVSKLLEDDELGGVDPKDYADQALNGPPEFQDALEVTLQRFCDQVRRDHAKMMKDGVARVLAVDKGWRRRFPHRHDHSRLLAQAVTARQAARFVNAYANDREVRSMRKIVDDWLRFS